MREPTSTGLGVMKLGGIALSGLLGTTFLCGTAAPGLAAGKEASDILDVSMLEAISDRTLGDLRGGFMVGNYDINFGVTITTTINGNTVLRTTFVVSNPNQIDNVITQWLQDGQNLFDSNGSKVDVDVDVDHDDGEFDIDTDADVDVEAKGVDVDVDIDVLTAVAEFDAAMAVAGAASGAGGAGGTGSGLGAGPGNVAPVDQVAQAVSGLPTAVSAPEIAAPAIDFAAAPPVTADDAVASAAAVIDPGTTVDTATAETALPQLTDPNTIVQGANGFALVKTANGFALNGPGTTVIHEVTNGVLAEILNVDNNVSISHSTDMNMTIANFSDVARQGAIHQQLQNLASEINSHGL